MVTTNRLQVLFTALLLPLVAFSAAGAQTVSINSVSSNTPSFGNLAGALVGNTVFRITTAAVVTKVSGNGGDTPSGTQTAATVNIRCSGGSSCSSATAIVKIDDVATVSGRANGVSNFTVASGTATVGTVTVNGDGSIQFPVTGLQNNSNRTILVGMDMSVKGDDVSTSTASTAQWTVAVALSPTVPTVPGTNGTATGTIRRSLSATTTPIAFGPILDPDSGSGTVTIDSSSGARTAGGTNLPKLMPGGSSSRGTVVISGQPSTTFTVTTPSSFTITDGTTTLTSTVTRTATGTLTLSAAGAYTLGIGGVLTVPSTATTGNYTGTITATVAYN